MMLLLELSHNFFGIELILFFTLITRWYSAAQGLFPCTMDISPREG